MQQKILREQIIEERRVIVKHALLAKICVNCERLFQHRNKNGVIDERLGVAQGCWEKTSLPFAVFVCSLSCAQIFREGGWRRCPGFKQHVDDRDRIVSIAVHLGELMKEPELIRHWEDQGDLRGPFGSAVADG